MCLISLESCDVALSNSICYILTAFLGPKIHHNQYKPTEHLNIFDAHCMCVWVKVDIFFKTINMYLRVQNPM